MDTGSIVAIVIASITALGTLYATYRQGKKDDQQAILDQERQELEKKKLQDDANEAARLALKDTLAEMRSELERVRNRVGELEGLITNKDNLIATLQQSVFDKDVKIRTLQFSFDNLKMRLEMVENSAAISPEAKRLLKKLRMEQELEAPGYKLQAIQEATAELGMEPPSRIEEPKTGE